jgi:hypothetical protein
MAYEEPEPKLRNMKSQSCNVNHFLLHQPINLNQLDTQFLSRQFINNLNNPDTQFLSRQPINNLNQSGTQFLATMNL